MNKKLILFSLIFFFLCFELVYAKNSNFNVDSIFNNFYGINNNKNNELPMGKIGMANPAAVYCKDLGYNYKIVETDKGQKGVCVFPDNSECEEWQFLTGSCGQSYSYCVKKGYNQKIKTDGKNAFSRNYVVCVGKTFPWFEVGSVTNLMDLSGKATRASTLLSSSLAKTNGDKYSISSLPSAFDWRNNTLNGVSGDWMTPVKNQGSCGSCWAHSATGVVEAEYNIVKNNPALDLNLAEQYLVSDCLYTGNCCGGWADVALRFIRDNNGTVDENCFPYADKDSCTCNANTNLCNNDCKYHDGFKGWGNCSDKICSDKCADWQTRLVNTINYVYDIPSNRNTMKEYLINKGPLAAGMCFGSDCKGRWDGAIYRCDNDTPPVNDILNHDIIITGYNDTGQYWIIKNSWGIGFNDEPDPKDGYFFLGYGECHIEEDAHYAINDTTPPTPVTNLHSTTHVIDKCTSDNSIRVTWNSATDAVSGSGLDGYSYKWSNTDSDLPDKTVDIDGSTVSLRQNKNDGCWYFHIRSADNVGNWNSFDVSDGPYCIDTLPPYNVTTLWSTSHSLNTLSNDNTVDISWTNALDNDTLSPTCFAGATNYSISWSEWFPAQPDTVAEISTDVTTNTSSPLSDGEWYFNIRSVDGAGNWQNDYASIGPFIIDTKKPYHVFRDAQYQWYGSTAPYFNIDFFDDQALKDSYFQYDSSAGTWLVINTSNPGTSYMTDWLASNWAGVKDGTHYLYFKITDDAGNVYITPNNASAFLFYKDTTPPTVSVLGAPTNWQKAVASASVNCSDTGQGCDASTYVIKYYDSNPGSCPTSYGSYDRGSPQNIYSQKWVCAAAKDKIGSPGFSTPVEFKVDRINPIPEAGPNQYAMKYDVVSFSGSATDSGGSGVDTSSYSWDFGDGKTGTGQSPTHSYSKSGTYTVTLTVKDNAKNSGSDTLTVYIKAKPNAIIDSISPKPVIQGETVNFVGHGTDEDGNVVAYNWRSDLSGQLSTAASFNTNTLLVGYHTIYFKVQDNDSYWSDEVSSGINVYSPPDWKMFHRLIDHTGSTGSPIPNAGNQIYATKWSVATGNQIYSSPAIADLDNNKINGLETVVSSKDGSVYAYNSTGSQIWKFTPAANPQAFDSSPAIADIDNDGNLEVVIGCDNGNVYAITNAGNQKWMFTPAVGPQAFDSSPAIADIDNDGNKEIVIGNDNGKVYAITNAGAQKWAYASPNPAPNGFESSPAISEMDSTSAGLEIIIGSDDSSLYVLSSAGVKLASIQFQANTPIHSSPAIADLRTDGQWAIGKEIVVGADNGNLYIVNYNQNNPLANRLTTICNSNIVGAVLSSPAIGFLYEDPTGEIAIDSNAGRVYAINKQCAQVGIYPPLAQPPLGPIVSSPAIADIDRPTNNLEVVVGSSDGNIYAIDFGNHVNPLLWQVATVPNGAVQSSPAVGEIDHDGIIEVAVGSNNNKLYMLHALNPVQDSDGDNITDVNDNCPYVNNTNQLNSDGDTFGDLCDNCPLITNQNQLDTDGDGIGNACDNCPSISNLNQTDNDNDTIGNVCDNCLNISNPAQTDTDNDGFGLACDCNDNDATVYPGAPELCDNKDNNCDGTIDNFNQSCGSNGCLGIHTCTAGVWSDCSSSKNDCGICCTCDSSGQETYNDTQVTDCGLCQKCGSLFTCSNQTSGDDLKNECSEDICNYGYCDGSGKCAPKTSGTNCGLCKSCNGQGSCSSWPVDDSNCGAIDCDGLDTTCRNYNDLTSNRCNGFGICKEPNSIGCTDYTNAPSNTDCGTCASCNGTGSCNAYNPTQNNDCNSFNKSELSTCIWNPDNNNYTLDYHATIDSVCESFGHCTHESGYYNYTHTCNVSQCGATCEKDEDCNDFNPDTIDVCMDNCTCEHRPFVQPCGDGVKEYWEECDPKANPTGCSTGNVCDPNLCTCKAACTCTPWVDTGECAPGSKYPHLSSIWTRTCYPSGCAAEEIFKGTRFCWV